MVARATTSTRGLYVLALVAFVALGLPDGVLGVAWPSMRADLDQPVSALGVLLVALTVGYLLATAANGALVAALGTGRLLAASAGVAVVGFATFAVSPTWPVLVTAAVGLGAAAGMVDAGVNAHVAVHHGRRAMGLLHAAFGGGATAGPLLVTGLLRADTSWRAAYGLIAGVQAALLCAFLLTRHHWSRPPADGSAPTHPTAPGTGTGTRSRRVFVLTLAAFFVYTGLEIATGQWAYSLLTEQRGTAATAAGLWVAAYWAALTGGRLAMAVGADAVAPSTLLGGATLGAVAGTALLWLDPAGAGALGLPLVGLSLAPVFPTLVSLTPVRLGNDRAASAIGYQLSAAGIGAAALPGGVALAVEAGGLGTLGPALVAMAVVLLGLHHATEAVARPAPAGAAP